MSLMRLAALFSGGKDSMWAVYKALQEGHEIEYLVTIEPETTSSYMFHSANITLTRVQAKLMNMPLVNAKTKGEKEKELEDLKQALKPLDVEGILSGAIASSYQKQRVENICKELDLVSVAPSWNRDEEEYLHELLDNKFEIIISSISAGGLDESWLGRTIDKKAISDLKELSKKHGLSMVGEGGEYCTTVLDCPLFSKRIAIKKAEKKIEGLNRGFYIIKEHKLLEK